MKNAVLKKNFDDYLDFKMDELKNETDKYFADKYANELVGYISAAVDLNFITKDEWRIYNGEIQELWFDVSIKIITSIRNDLKAIEKRK